MSILLDALTLVALSVSLVTLAWTQTPPADPLRGVGRDTPGVAGSCRGQEPLGGTGSCRELLGASAAPHSG